MGQGSLGDSVGAALIILAVFAVVLGPLLILIWWRGRALFRAMIALRDRIDGGPGRR